MTMTLRRYPPDWPNPLICVCAVPDYIGSVMCGTCGRPPLGTARAEYGLTTDNPDWKDR